MKKVVVILSCLVIFICLIINLSMVCGNFYEIKFLKDMYFEDITDEYMLYLEVEGTNNEEINKVLKTADKFNNLDNVIVSNNANDIRIVKIKDNRYYKYKINYIVSLILKFILIILMLIDIFTLVYFGLIL